MDSLEEFSKNLRSVLIGYQNGVALDALNTAYNEFFFEDIPFRRLGHSSLHSLLDSLPSVCTCTRVGRQLNVLPVADASTEHIRRMVESQKPSQKAAKKLSARPPAVHRPQSTVPRHSMATGARSSSVASSRNSIINNNGCTKYNKSASSRMEFSELCATVQRCVNQYPRGFFLSKLAGNLGKHYQCHIRPCDYGYGSWYDLVCDERMGLDVVEGDRDHIVYVRPASQQQPPRAKKSQPSASPYSTSNASSGGSANRSASISNKSTAATATTTGAASKTSASGECSNRVPLQASLLVNHTASAATTDSSLETLRKNLSYKITSIVRQFPDGMSLMMFIQHYEMRYGKLDVDKYQYSSVRDCLCNCSEVFLSNKNKKKMLLAKSAFLPMEMEYKKLYPNGVVGPDFAFKAAILPSDFILERKFHPIIIGEVFSPGFFYFMLNEANYFEQCNTIMDEMNLFYSDDNTQYHVDLNIVKPGLVVAAPYKELGYHRAIVLSTSNSDVEVFYFDYGSTHIISFRHLRFLMKEYAELPAQAFVARLSLIKPTSNDGVWTNKAKNDFFRLVDISNNLFAAVENSIENSIFEIVIVNTTTEVDVYVHTELVNHGNASCISAVEGNAKSTQDSIPKKDDLSNIIDCMLSDLNSTKSDCKPPSINNLNKSSSSEPVNAKQNTNASSKDEQITQYGSNLLKSPVSSDTAINSLLSVSIEKSRYKLLSNMEVFQSHINNLINEEKARINDQFNSLYKEMLNLVNS